MIQFFNNLWIALSSENAELVNILLLPLYPIEAFLIMNLFLIIFNIPSNRKEKIIYTFSISLLSIITLAFIPSPFYVLINYVLMILLIMVIFKLNLLKSFISLMLSSFIFGLFNVLLQKPYISILNISFDNFMNTPIYRIGYVIILYLIIYGLSTILKNIKTIHFSLNLLDSLDKKTLKILYINLGTGFLSLFIQFVSTAFYIDIVPMFISLLNFILLMLFFSLSIYSFTRIIKLANTRKDLECAEDYNKSLEILYDKVKGFKHDFDNIVSTLDGFIENNDMPGLKDYFDEVKKDCKITNNLSVLNPRIIDNPGIYSLLNTKYFKATNLGVNFEIEYFLNLNKIEVNLYQFSRILGILIDNAIEEAEKCKNKNVKISFIREHKNNRSIITVKNTYSNKDVNIDKIFDKGESGKKDHSGIGLWEVKNYIRKSKNLDLFTNKNDKFFTQELSIYDM